MKGTVHRALFRVQPSFGQPATVLLFEGRRYTGCVTSFDPSLTRRLPVFKFRAAREERELVSMGNVDGDGAKYAWHFRAPSPMVGLPQSGGCG